MLQLFPPTNCPKTQSMQPAEVCHNLQQKQLSVTSLERMSANVMAITLQLDEFRQLLFDQMFDQNLERNVPVLKLCRQMVQ